MAQHLDCWDGSDFNFPDHLQLQERPQYTGRRQLPDWMVQDPKRVQSEKGSQVHKRPEPEPVLMRDGPANGGGATSSKKAKPSVDKEFNFEKQNQELAPEPSVETRAEPECHVPKSVNVQQQGGSKIMAVPRSVRNKHVLNMSDPGPSTSISVTDKAKTRPRFVSATSSTKSDDKASDTPVEMASNGSDNESTSNSSENDGSVVPEEHALHIFLCDSERPGYKPKEWIEDTEGNEEYRVVMNRKYLQNWQNGIDSFAPEVQVDPPEGECWRCGCSEWGYGSECRCSAFDKANRPGPEPRVCTKQYPKQFNYPGERFGYTMPTMELMEKNREAENRKLFETWYKKWYGRFLC